ncbi:MAG TPA: hypothetical protein VN903_01590 [Polyangia bacterium]|jgi:hypothetical protein|nr:hypothetical protein [Polyangia bacterium]
MTWPLLVLLAVAAPSSAAAAPAEIPWQWERAVDLFPRIDITAGPYVLATEKRKMKLRGPSWSVKVPARFGGRVDEMNGAALAADGGRVFVAVYLRAASTCQLAAFDGASGKQLWSVDLDGIGPIGHSAYSNRVQLRMIGGHPTVFGNESAKRYIEQRDAATGALVSHRLLPPEARPVLIGEWLFREVDHTLRKHPAYTLKANDFLSRLNMMKDADHAERGAAFTEAVGQLAALKQFEIKLVDTGDDFDVVAKRLP